MGLPNQYFLTIDSETQWLSFQLTGHQVNHASATVTGVEERESPLGNVLSGDLSQTMFSAEVKASQLFSFSGSWQGGFTAWYDAVGGTVDVPMSLLMTGLSPGQRLFLRLVANSGNTETLLATVEMVYLGDQNREPEDPGFIAVCDSDTVLSFRMSSASGGSVEKTYIGPHAMSGGALYQYEVRLRWPYMLDWGEPHPTYYDPKTALIDAGIAGTFAYSEYGETIEYKLTPYGSDEAIATGLLVYSNDCTSSKPPVFNLVSDGRASVLRFQLNNFADISQAVVTSVELVLASAPLAGTSGSFALEYKIDSATEWASAPIYFDGVSGVAEVDVEPLIDAAVKTIQFRIVQ